MNVINDNTIEMKDGTLVSLPKCNHMKLNFRERNGKERLIINGKEFKDGKFKVTLASVFNYLFG